MLIQDEEVRPMTQDDILAALDQCEMIATTRGARSIVAQLDQISPRSQVQRLCHLVWMIEVMRPLIVVGPPGGGYTHDDPKVHRWLGFIQGVLWSQGVVTIDQLRHMNNPPL